MKNYTNYEFVLVLRDVDENTPGLEDAMFEAGCDDAMISYKNGVVSLTFDRKAANIQDAILSAIGSIESSSLNTSVDHIEGAFVTLSEIAERSGFTKQAISLFIQGKRGNGHFPIPFTGVNSTSPIWRWADVLLWLFNNKKIEHTAEIEEAAIIDDINARLYMRKFANMASHLTKSDIKNLTQGIKKK